MDSFIFDIETNGLLPELTKIHCLCIKNLNTNKKYSYYGNEQIRLALDVLNTGKEIIGHNIISFDIPALQKVYPDWKPKAKIVDTLVLSRLIEADLINDDFDKNLSIPKKLYGSHSLKAWGLRLGNHKGDYNGGWETFSEEMLKYCEQDLEVTHELLKRLNPEKYSQDAIELEHKVSELCDRIGKAGWDFDVKKASELYGKLSKERTHLEEQLQTLFEPWEIQETFIPKVNNKTRGYVKGEPFIKKTTIEFNPNSRKHIQFCLQKKYDWKPKKFTPSGDAQIDESVLITLPYPEAQKLARMFLLQKRIGMIAEGRYAWLKLVTKDNKLHHNLISNGTVTGRSSSRSPNLQQVPATRAEYGKECRELFSVPKGYQLLGADLSGLELRCLAHFLDDDGAYAKEILNGDIHTKNQNDAGLPTRDQAKTFIYALVYGGGVVKLGSIVNGGAKEGKILQKKFYQANPSFKVLKDRVEDASRRGFLYGLDKRKLKIRSTHKGLNTLLQSCGAIICKQWILNIDQAFREEKLDAYIVAWVHDEVQIAFKGEGDYVGNIIKRMAKKSGEDFQIKIPIEAEFKVGANWASTH